MTDNDKRMQEIAQVQTEYIDDLMAYPHVVGVGIGLRQQGGEYTDELCLVVMVDEKVPIAQLAPDAVLPRVLDNVGIDVQETGSFSA